MRRILVPAHFLFSRHRSLVALIIFTTVSTASGADTVKVKFDVPAGDAGKTLKVFAKQAQREIIFPVKPIGGVKTNAVQGDFSVADGLERLLAGTELTAHEDEKTGGLIIQRQADPNAQRAVATTANRPSQSAQTDYEEKKAFLLEEFVVKDSKPFQGSDIDIPRSPDDIQPYYEWNSDAIENSGATNIQDFFQRMVPMDTNRFSSGQGTGGSIQTNISLGGLSNSSNGGTYVGTQNTLILLNGLPLPNVSDLTAFAEPDLSWIPLAAIDHIEVLPASASAIYGPGAAAGVVNIVLKHDYVGAQLSASYENTFDKDAPIRTVSLTAGQSLEGGKTHILVTASYQTEKTPLLQDRLQVIGPYQNRYMSGLPGGELAYVGLTTGSSAFTNNGTPALAQPVIASVSGGPLFAGSSATVVQVPVGYQGGQGLAPLQANIGNFNLSHPNLFTATGILGNLFPLNSGSTVKSFGLNLRRQMASWLEFYTQFGIATTVAPGLTSGGFGSVTVPAAAPGNPFGQAVKVSFTDQANWPTLESNSLTRNLSVGAKISLPYGWNSDWNYTWGYSDFATVGEENGNTTGLQTAVNNGTVNVIADLDRYPLNLIPYYAAYLSANNGTSTVDALQVKAAGPLMKLWAGAPSLALGAEHDKNGGGGGLESVKFPENATIPNVAPSSLLSEYIYAPGESESDNSGYAELTVPLVSKANGVPGIRQLDLQAAGRIDSIKEFTTGPVDEVIINAVNGTVINSPSLASGASVPYVNSTTSYHSSNGTIGLKYRPVDDVILRASYSTAFVPPAFSQLLVPISFGTINQPTGAYPGVPTSSPWGYQAITDPMLNANYDVPVKGGGNPSLKPETSKGFTWGIVLEPSLLPGFRVSLDYTRVTKDSDIIVPALPTLIADASQFPGRVIRGTPNPGQSVGPIVFIDDTDINAPETWTSSYDLEVDYAVRTASFGTWKLSGLANFWQHYQIQSTLGAPFAEQLGNPDAAPIGSTGLGTAPGLAKFTGNIGLDWTKGPFSAGWRAHYVGPYTDGSNNGLGGTNFYGTYTVNGWISGQIYHDVYLGYKMGRSAGSDAWWRRALANTSVRLGVKNLFNHIPPYDAAVNLIRNEFYSTYGDIRLADYYLTVKKTY